MKLRRRAVEIDPNLAEGHTALGQAILCRDYAWASAEHHMVRAIELDPNYSPARIWYALQLAMEGRFSEALREAHTGAIWIRWQSFRGSPSSGVRIMRAVTTKRIGLRVRRWRMSHAT